jgi:hypothetical protein
LVTGYSFNKEDAVMPGQESWSLTKWNDVAAPDEEKTLEPTFVLRGISEGQGTPSIAGIVFSGQTTEASTGNVSAGGFGRADKVTIGVVSSVGGGSSTVGETGT